MRQSRDIIKSLNHMSLSNEEAVIIEVNNHWPICRFKTKPPLQFLCQMVGINAPWRGRPGIKVLLIYRLHTDIH